MVVKTAQVESPQKHVYSRQHSNSILKIAKSERKVHVGSTKLIGTTLAWRLIVFRPVTYHFEQVSGSFS